MGERTKIEWCDHTFNPWWGCTKISAGCENCYAERFSHRFDKNLWGASADRMVASPKYWSWPTRWNARAASRGIRETIFCGSMCDVFEDRGELEYPRAHLIGLIWRTPTLEWLLLTKRPESAPVHQFQRLPNVRIGASIEDQDAADRRIPHLLAAPAGGNRPFLSCEPLLGPIEIQPHLKSIGWVIVGGESGPGARPMNPDWARSLRDQCQAAGVPFFFKQWGGVNKKLHGRELDGREWNEKPDLTPAVISQEEA